MKPSSIVLHIIAVLIMSAPLLYLAIIWHSIPAIIAIHYDIHLKPDRMGDKSELWVPAIILASCSLLVYVLMNNINKIDPKRVGADTPASFKRLSLVIVAIISLLNLVIVMMCTSKSSIPDTLFVPVVALVFVAIGNYFPSLKPNYFAGIRLPWTLNSESNWKKTHQLAGKLWFWGGLLVAIVSLLLPMVAGVFILMAAVFLMILIPGIYSYRLFQKEKTTRL